MEMKRKTLSWPAELAGLTRKSRGLCKNPNIRVRESKISAVGYTSEDGDIYVAKDDSLYDGLTEIEKQAARMGIVTHECLHKIFTDFESSKFASGNYKSYEQKIFAEISNILEDPAIEYLAPTVVGGTMLKSLDFVIKHTYKKSPKISEPYKTSDGRMGTPSPYGQYCRALIQFGDMGLLKGSFTSKKAAEVFAQTDDLFLQGIMEPNGKKRVEISKEIFKLSKPLWEEEVKTQEAIDKLLEEIASILSEKAFSEMSGSGSGETPDTEDLKPDKKKAKRRNRTIIKVSKEMYDALTSGKDNADADSDNEDGIIIVAEDQENAKTQKGKSSSDSKNTGNENGKKGKGESEGNSDDAENKKGKGDAEGNSSKENDKNGNKSSEKKGDAVDSSSKEANGSKSDGTNDSSSDSNSSSDKISNASDNDTKNSLNKERIPDKNGRGIVDKSDAALHLHGDEDEDMVIDEEEYNLTEEDERYIIEEAEKLQKSYEDSMKESPEDDTIPENYDIETPALRGLSCLNLNVNKNDAKIEDSYNSLISVLYPQIKSASSQLQKIFEQDYESKEYKTSGSVSFKKMNSGKVSPRIFTKRRTPNGKRDIAVAILVDESGSMCFQDKHTAASQCCVALAEIFNRLDIPIYVMGFTADTKGHDIVHYHYIKWNNNLTNRQKLLNISARVDNCDGYSIRYISKILKKRKEQNKLLIVLSDGQPAACNYNDGIADTKAAIREAKKYANVLGVAIGDADTDTIRYMYEKNFLHISNVNDLFYGLSKEIRTIFKNL